MCVSVLVTRQDSLENALNDKIENECRVMLVRFDVDNKSRTRGGEMDGRVNEERARRPQKTRRIITVLLASGK